MNDMIILWRYADDFLFFPYDKCNLFIFVPYHLKWNNFIRRRKRMISEISRGLSTKVPNGFECTCRLGKMYFFHTSTESTTIRFSRFHVRKWHLFFVVRQSHWKVFSAFSAHTFIHLFNTDDRSIVIKNPRSMQTFRILHIYSKIVSNRCSRIWFQTNKHPFK